MWSIFAIVSGLFYTLQGLITRHILKGNKKDAWAFSFYFSAVGVFISLPFFLTNIRVAHTWPYWIMMLVVGLLVVLQNLLNFKSANHLPASISGAMTKFRLVWVFILGVIILKEALTWQKTFGTALAVLAGIIILNKAKKNRIYQRITIGFFVNDFLCNSYYSIQVSFSNL
ncbi:MAG: EamA family transporter [Candidatus Roizmanbacteria bacterium]|nr:EamA family transporter [Candidatus Roizmanbacteria bacterium]